MKTRIISGIVMIIIVGLILTLGILVSPIFINAFLGLICGVAIYEMLHNALGIKSKTALIGASIYGLISGVVSLSIYYFVLFSVLYAVFAVVICLVKHKEFDAGKILAFLSFPIVLSFAFVCLGTVIKTENGLYYLLLLLNFSCVCDMGAYFVGVTMGKHKLCPEISPKKTVEGAIGGIISSVLVSLIIVLSFGVKGRMIWTLILTIPLCIVGMLGDLFASVIKRSVGIKDYGNLIPGHGGILDRFDSMLLIAPVLYCFALLGVI